MSRFAFSMLLLLKLGRCEAWAARAVPRGSRGCVRCSALPSDVDLFEEPAAIAAAKAVEWTHLLLDDKLATGLVEASFIRTSAVTTTGSGAPVVLLHSFDSSCLEWRRVLPLLNAAGVEAFALDSLGWGFSSTQNATSIGVESKRDHLRAFCQQYLHGRPAMLVGSSLGAATIIDFVDVHPELVESVVLLDPQGYIDGAPPVPPFAARAGIRLLRSWPLRSLGQLIAYEDVARCATDDAIRVGRLHCSRDGWEDDQRAWLLSGGYSVSPLVGGLERALGDRCLLLWGRQDRVLSPAQYVPRFVNALPSATFRWVERCGHVPHLEQPAVVAAAIAAWRRGEGVQGDGDPTSATSASASSAAAKDASPLERLNAFLDRPILDTNVRGGPLEPLKRWIRTEPELAQASASIVALSFFAAIGVLLGRLANGAF